MAERTLPEDERIKRLRTLAASSVVGGDLAWLLSEYDKLTKPITPVGGDSDKFVCPLCDGEGSVFND